MGVMRLSGQFDRALEGQQSNENLQGGVCMYLERVGVQQI